MTVHVRPEAETQRTSGLVGGGGELLRHQQRLVPGPARVGGVNVRECSGHAVGGEARVVSLGSSVGIVASTTLNVNRYFLDLFEHFCVVGERDTCANYN